MTYRRKQNKQQKQEGGGWIYGSEGNEYVPDCPDIKQYSDMQTMVVGSPFSDTSLNPGSGFNEDIIGGITRPSYTLMNERLPTYEQMPMTVNYPEYAKSFSPALEMGNQYMNYRGGGSSPSAAKKAVQQSEKNVKDAQKAVKKAQKDAKDLKEKLNAKMKKTREQAVEKMKSMKEKKADTKDKKEMQKKLKSELDEMKKMGKKQVSEANSSVKESKKDLEKAKKEHKQMQKALKDAKAQAQKEKAKKKSAKKSAQK